MTGDIGEFRMYDLLCNVQSRKSPFLFNFEENETIRYPGLPLIVHAGIAWPRDRLGASIVQCQLSYATLYNRRLFRSRT